MRQNELRVCDSTRFTCLGGVILVVTLLCVAMLAVPVLAGLFDNLPGDTTAGAQPSGSAGQGGAAPATMPSSDVPPTTAMTRPAPSPVPDAAARQRASKLVQDVFGSELARSKLPAERIDLSRRLLQAGIDERTDRAGRYVLFTLALENAEASGSVAITFRAADEIGDSFLVDLLKLKAESAEAVAHAARSSQDRVDLIKTLTPLIDECVSEDRYDLARQMAEIAVAEARSVDPSLARAAVTHLQEVREAQAASLEATAAAQLLRRKPADPEANLVVGKFRCFVKDDWAHGLPLLAAGSDPGLKRVALSELNGVASPDARIALGDAWWDEAEKFPAGQAKLACQRHAAGWYGEVVASLEKGLVKDKLELRINSVARPQIPPSGVSLGGAPPSASPAAPIDTTALSKLTPEQRAVAAGLRFGRFTVLTDREWTYTKADLFVVNDSPMGQVTEKVRARVRLLCVNADQKPTVLEYWSDLKIAQRGEQWLHLSGVENSTIKFNNRNNWIPVNAHIAVYFDDQLLYEQVWKPGGGGHWWDDAPPARRQ